MPEMIMVEMVDYYRFRATVEDSEPAVWRDFYVPEIASFFDLRVVIQAAFGWVDLFPHKFTCGFEIGDIDEFLNPIVINERLVSLDQASDQDVIYECKRGENEWVIRLERSDASYEGDEQTGKPEVIGGAGFPALAMRFRVSPDGSDVDMEAVNAYLAEYPFAMAPDWETAQHLRRAVDAVALQRFNEGVKVRKTTGKKR